MARFVDGYTPNTTVTIGSKFTLPSTSKLLSLADGIDGAVSVKDQEAYEDVKHFWCYKFSGTETRCVRPDTGIHADYVEKLVDNGGVLYLSLNTKEDCSSMDYAAWNGNACLCTVSYIASGCDSGK